MINIKFDEANFTKKLKKNVETLAVQGTKQLISNKLSLGEMSKLKFTYDENKSVVNIDGPPEILKKLK